MYKYLNTKQWFIYSVLFFFGNSSVFSQDILNGDFEINNAPSGTDQIGLTNFQFNSLVQYCTSYGSAPAGLDLITTGTWDGFAYSGNWYLGIEGGGVEIFSMEISTPLIIGESYKISFYDRGREVHCTAPVEIGISSVNNDFGQLIYSSPTPTVGEWNLRCFTFTPQSNAEYITVRAGGDIGCWTKIDGFNMEIAHSPCVDFSMPNVFTPNDDDVNDIFKPIKFHGIKEAKLTVLNRWGNKVHQTDDVEVGWNGTFNNSECSDGVYFWILTYTDIFDETKTEHGFLTLIR